MDYTTSEKKKLLRKEILQKRSELSPEEQERTSKIICEKIQKEPAYQQATNVCLYMPIRQEVSLLFLVEEARHQGKSLWLPKVEGKQMEFFAYEKGTELREGSFGILEPSADKKLLPDARTLVILPGAVFTRNGQRIGYGGGYYDRYLKQHPECQTIAVAYALQIVEKLPTEAHDISVSRVIFE